jgi:tRNA dimethylallyltransferase
LLVVVGPTASGKTELSLTLADRLGGEIISADSVQVYRHFEIGTGKPSSEQRARAPHHLIDYLDPLDSIDAAAYARDADGAIEQIRMRGKVPIVCGGTFLWVRALLYGLAPAPPKDEAIRDRHREIAETEGRAALHARLKSVDPESAARLAPNDLIRVSRALEVFELTGKTLTELHGEHGFSDLRYTPQLIGIRYSSEALSARIAERAQHMLNAGWIEEVRDLSARGYAECRAMRSVGYAQVSDALRSGAALDLDLLLTQIVQKTRIFARRQRTWLREEPVLWLEPEQARDPDLDTILRARS